MGIVWMALQVVLVPALFAAGWLAARRLPRRGVLGAALAVAGAMTGQYLLTWRPDLMDAWLPADFVYFELTGLAPPSGFLLGAAAALVPSRFAQRGLALLAVVLGIQTGLSGAWVLGDPGVTREATFVREVVCRQTTDWTCGAAALVSQLRANGIASTEAEMAKLCLTSREKGVTTLRLAFGLRRKLAGTAWRVKLLRLDESGLRRVRKPVVVDVKYDTLVDHIVTVLKVEEEASGTLVWVGDPLMGFTPKRIEEFLADWRGNAVAMYRSDPFGD
ncbi:MAG: hypothetical protein HZA54_05420 [Planctomycetes bacterium]|nr:hypothetical protein [Planctomycetota bacterium]